MKTIIDRISREWAREEPYQRFLIILGTLVCLPLLPIILIAYALCFSVEGIFRLSAFLSRIFP